MIGPGASPPLDPETIRRLVRAALDEDGATHDLTTAAVVPADQSGRAAFLFREPGALCGLDLARETFHTLDPALRWQPQRLDGDAVAAGDTVAEVSGRLPPILQAERVALNFVQRLSGIATLTRQATACIQHTSARLLDTRKTTPGLRVLERYAVRVGGGHNHRYNLAAGILIKDNHIAAVRARGGTLTDAVRRAIADAGPATGVEVEVTSIAELEEALAAGARAVLLDNMPIDLLRTAVQIAHDRGALTEASGGITLDALAAIAATGVDYISMGALTHSARALDIALEVKPA